MLIRFLTLVATVAVEVFCPPEYYSVLGLQRGAGEGEIKRAFKRLAAKYHPDRASASQKDEFNRKFSEISDAYSTLSDPELKNVYDHRGHDGIKEFKEHQDWQNQHKARQEMHESMVTDHFQGTDLQILNIQSLSRFYRRSTPWLVLFYRSGDREMRSGLKEAILDLNNKFYGIFTVAAVNCDVDDGICDEYRAINTPDILGFPSDVSHEGTRYTGDKTVAKMAGFMVSLMQDFVSIVTPSNIEEFLSKWDKVKMLYFSAKKDVPPLMKALSKEFRTSIDIGQVKDETNSIMQRFSIPQLPYIIIIKNLGNEVVPYQGEITLMGLSDFIREHRDLSATNKNKKKSRKLLELTKPEDIEKNGCGPSSKNLCVFIPYRSPQEKELIVAETALALEQMGDEPVVLQIVDSASVQFDKLGVDAKSPFFIFRPARCRLYFSTADSFSAKELLNALDLAVGGTLQFQSFKGNLLSALGGEKQDL
jgi:DnaJ-domain-containing protein 1